MSAATKQTDGIDLDNPEFQTIYSLLLTTRSSVFMTGRAGTGKSTFLKYITGNIGKKYVVLAPTGIAAVNVGGVTLHSFFRIPLQPLMPDDVEFSERRLRKRLKYPAELVKILRELELIIIDEISMVRADILDFVDKVLRFYTGNRREPFGGKQLLLVGDTFQLEPVVTADMREIMRRWYRSPYFFDALVFRDIDLVPVELRKVYRQDDATFINLLDRVRVGGVSPDDLRLINSRYAPQRVHGHGGSDDPMVMTLASRRDTVNAFNDERLASLPGMTFDYEAAVTGEFPDSSMPAERHLTLKVDAQVVFIRNDREHRWVNGTLGRVCELSSDSVKIELEDGSRHTVDPEIWENIKYTYDEVEHRVVEDVIGTFTQLPVRLAWALTIHKSQGLTFNRVRIDMGRGAFSSGQTYVALSRCRSLAGLELASPLSERDVLVNPAVVNFARNFNDGHLIRRAILNARADTACRRGVEALNARDIDAALDSLFELAELRPADLVAPLNRRFIRRKLGFVRGLEAGIAALRARLDEDRRRFDDMAEEYVALGNICMEGDDDFAPALANYERALRLSPDNLNAMLGRARTLVAMGEHDRAVEAYRHANERHPDNYNVAMELADTCFALNQLHEAMNYYMVAAGLCPDRPEPLTRLAGVYDAIGEADEAEALRVKARSLGRRRRRR